MNAQAPRIIVPDFDEASHTYRVDGQVVPSVTQAIETAGIVDLRGVPTDILQAAKERGGRVHRACHYFLDNDLDWSSVDSIDLPYVEACRRFIADSGFKVLEREVIDDDGEKRLKRAHEIRLFHPTFRYAGTMDAFGVWDGVFTLVDWKTGDPAQLGADLQLAAYMEALRANPPKMFETLGLAGSLIRRVAVRLRKSGTYSVSLCTDTNDFPTFLACLTVTNYQRARGRGGRAA